MNGKIYICGGKQRRKLFEFDERNLTLSERSEMINGNELWRKPKAFLFAQTNGSNFLS